MDSVLVEGVHLPAQEHHLRHWMVASKGRHVKDGKITYQWKKQKAAMKYAMTYIENCKDKCFVDVGAHVGLWSMQWQERMASVVAFEPIPQMREIYWKNVQPNYVKMVECALGDETKELILHFNPHNTGNTHAMKAGEETPNPIKAKMCRLDDILPEALAQDGKPMGVLKIDCEGFEQKIIEGGLKVINEYKPLIIVEQKKGTDYYGFDPEGAANLLKEHGYQTLKIMSGDHIMVHKDCLK